MEIITLIIIQAVHKNMDSFLFQTAEPSDAENTRRTNLPFLLVALGVSPLFFRLLALLGCVPSIHPAACSVRLAGLGHVAGFPHTSSAPQYLPPVDREFKITLVVQ